MKSKTNISVLDNRGIRVNPSVIIGNTGNGYVSGDILDANAVYDVIKGGDDEDQSDINTLSQDLSGTKQDVTALQNAVSGIQGVIGTPTSETTNTVWENIESLNNLITADDPVGAIDKFDEITAFLANVSDTTLNGILSNFATLNDIQNMVESNTVQNIVVLTQQQYDDLLTKDPNTEYNIID